MVVSNPDIWEMLSNMGVFNATPVKPPLITNLMAHHALKSDMEDNGPVGRPKSCAGRIAQFA